MKKKHYRVVGSFKIERELLAKAKKLGINISELCRNAIITEIQIKEEPIK